MHSLIQHQTWKKRWIITFWSFQIPVLAVDIIILAILMGVEAHGTENSIGTKSSPIQAWTIINLVLAIIAFLINCVEISMYIQSDLSPKIYLWFNVFNSATWTIPFVYNIYMNGSSWAGRGWNDIYLYVGIGLSSFIFGTFIVSCIYALVVFRNYQKRSRTIYEKYANESGSSTTVYYN